LRFRHLVVGEPYDPDIPRWPDSSFSWTLTPSSSVGAELLISYDRPTLKEVDAVKTEAAQFGLLAGDHALVLTHRFGDQPWSDVPWLAAHQTHRPPGLPELPPGEDLVVLAVLIDAGTGLVEALRATSWEPEFAAAVGMAVERQLTNGANEQLGHAEIDGWYARFPRPEDLVVATEVRSG
jgi:hypothetical protein